MSAETALLCSILTGEKTFFPSFFLVCVRSFVRPFIRLCVRAFFVRACVRSFVRSFSRSSFVLSCVRASFHSLRSFTPSFAHSLIFSLVDSFVLE